MNTQDANVSSDEIKHFDRFADLFKTLHDINPVRLDFISQYTPFAKLKWLDVGCGAGILSEPISARGASVVGIDAAAQVIEVAKQHSLQANLSIDYQVTTVEAYAHRHAREFDVITCMELLEHVPDPLSVLTACHALLKADGALFVSTINRNLKSYLYAILGAEYVMNIIPKGTHQYSQFIKPTEMDKALHGAGFTTKASRGFSYSPFTRQARLTDDLSVNYLLYARKKP